MTTPTRRTDHDTVTVPRSQAGRIASGSFRMMFLLLVQYVLGVGYNLYGTAPTAAKKVEPFSSPLIAAHVIVGTLLIVGAIFVLVISVRAKVRLAVTTSSAGLLALLAAWATGSAFTENGDSGFSMAMAATTALALLCYLVNVWVFRPGRNAL